MRGLFIGGIADKPAEHPEFKQKTASSCRTLRGALLNARWHTCHEIYTRVRQPCWRVECWKQAPCQIFGQPQIGPVFFEFIQRKKDEGFGNGNFTALFKSIEEDQLRRGVLKVQEPAE